MKIRESHVTCWCGRGNDSLATLIFSYIILANRNVCTSLLYGETCCEEGREGCGKPTTSGRPFSGYTHKITVYEVPTGNVNMADNVGFVGLLQSNCYHDLHKQGMAAFLALGSTGTIHLN